MEPDYDANKQNPREDVVVDRGAEPRSNTGRIILLLIFAFAILLFLIFNPWTDDSQQTTENNNGTSGVIEDNTLNLPSF